MTQLQIRLKKYYFNDITSMKFFAVNTITKGDVVLNYKNLEIGTGRLGFSLASNIAKAAL
jgi:iron complex outermembrane receptor protein